MDKTTVQDETKRARAPKRVLLGFLLVGMLASGCGGGGGEPTSSDLGGTDAELEEGRSGDAGGEEMGSGGGARDGTLGDPLSGYTRLSEGDVAMLHSAVQAEIQACMEDRGFRYEQSPPSDGSLDEVASLVMDARQSDPDDLTGYGFSELNAAASAPKHSDGDLMQQDLGDPDGSIDPDSANAWIAELSEMEREKWMAALLGDGDMSGVSESHVSVKVGEFRMSWDPDACFAIGESAVYGDLEEWRVAEGMVSDVLRWEAKAKLEADSDVATGVASWAKCMQRHGFEVSSLEDPVRTLMSEFPPGTPAAESAATEAAMAPVDARCFQEAGLVSTIAASQEAIESEILAANEGLIVRYVELRNASIDRVK